MSKRVRLTEDGSLSDQDDFDGDSGPPPGLKSEQRREWNRKNARRSRQRKKNWIDALVQRALRLEKERNLLKHTIKSITSTQSLKYGEQPHPSGVFLGTSALPYTPTSAAAHVKGGQSAGLPALVPLNDVPMSRRDFAAQLRGAMDIKRHVDSLIDEDFELAQFLVRSGCPLIITDATPQNLCLWCSPAFLEVTKYKLADVIGHNPRFLQREEADTSGARTAICKALSESTEVQVVIINYRSDNTPFLSEMHIAPMRSPEGVVFYLGVLADVTGMTTQRGPLPQVSTLPKRPLPGRPRRTGCERQTAKPAGGSGGSGSGGGSDGSVLSGGKSGTKAASKKGKAKTLRSKGAAAGVGSGAGVGAGVGAGAGAGGRVTVRVRRAKGGAQTPPSKPSAHAPTLPEDASGDAVAVAMLASMASGGRSAAAAVPAAVAASVPAMAVGVAGAAGAAVAAGATVPAASFAAPSAPMPAMAMAQQLPPHQQPPHRPLAQAGMYPHVGAGSAASSGFPAGAFPLGAPSQPMMYYPPPVHMGVPPHSQSHMMPHPYMPAQQMMWPGPGPMSGPMPTSMPGRQ